MRSSPASFSNSIFFYSNINHKNVQFFFPNFVSGQSCAEKEKMMYIIINAGIKEKGFRIKRRKAFINRFKVMMFLPIKIL